MIQVDLLIFDLDGTLLDTRRDIASAVNQALRLHRLPEVSLEEITGYIGSGIRGLMSDVAQTASPATYRSLIQEFQRLFREQEDQNTELFPGVLEALQSITKKKVIVTNKSEMFTAPTLKRFDLEKYFEAFFSRESFLQAKPSSVPCVEVCKRFGVRPEKALMIGDTPIDMMAGQGAGVRTAGVFYGYTPRHHLLKYAPDITLENLRELSEKVL